MPGAIQVEPFGLLGGGQQLRHALVGKSVHADAAIRFRAGAQPLDGFFSVAAFVAERIKVGLRNRRARAHPE